jgi:allantoicase
MHPFDHAAVTRAQAAALEFVGNYVATTRAQAAALESVGNYVARMNAMPWFETYLPPRKGTKHKTLHVTESVLWMKKQKIAHRFPPPVYMDG